METLAEKTALRKLGCSGIQGFHTCGPMDASGLTVWLVAHEAET